MKHQPQQIAEERARINASIRAFFDARGYTEVETPIVVASPGMEPNLVPFETVVREPDGIEHKAGLITSPEYSMKKLLGLGMEKIFTITKVFRNEESLGGQHNPEFSMLEWYQQGADYKACMKETQELIESVANTQMNFISRSVKELFDEYVGVDLRSDSLKEACAKHNIETAADDTESDLFYRLFLERIEPNVNGNVFVYDYPTYQAALSRLTPDGNFGERFELYMNGLELCNGFTELTDANEQRRRFEIEAEERRLLGKTIHPIDEKLLTLLPSIQNPTYGNALGIDRLHMALHGRTSIEDVLLFPANQLF